MNRNKWTHTICNHCWNIVRPHEKFVALIDKTVEICCYCGKRHASGIYIRENPKNIKCQGNHAEDTNSESV